MARQRFARGAVDRLTGVEAVGRHVLGAESEFDRHVRDIVARGRPARHSLVMRPRVGTHHVAQWLRHFGLVDEAIEAARPQALVWALERGSRSGRVAYQFARDYAGRHHGG